MIAKCQIFTPPSIAAKLLKIADYTKDLYGKKIIDNSCGDGNILCVVVEQYIIDCLEKKMSLIKIRNGLEKDVYGIEIDPVYSNKCKQRLDDVTYKFGIEKVHWNILNTDALTYKFDFKFDYIIGNPPYIMYKEIEKETRQYVRSNYEVCSTGKFDYCYAFIENGIKSLSSEGVMVYLIPNSIFKNVFGNKLREFILPFLTNIYDYKSKKIFNALTSSAIITCRKKQLKKAIIYHDCDTEESYSIKKRDLESKWKWIFEKKKAEKRARSSRFGDFFHASLVVATLHNKAFVLTDKDLLNYQSNANNIRIEKEIIRPAASPRALSYDRKEYIIFPYYYNKGKLWRFAQDEFSLKFPGAAIYLETFKNQLKARKSDNNTQWFEYGRSQAISHLNQKKLLVSTVVTKKVKVYELKKEFIPYSGIYIIKKGSISLTVAKNILESNEFMEYVKKIGINASGVSLRITAKDINDFLF